MSHKDSGGPLILVGADIGRMTTTGSYVRRTQPSSALGKRLAKDVTTCRAALLKSTSGLLTLLFPFSVFVNIIINFP